MDQMPDFHPVQDFSKLVTAPMQELYNLMAEKRQHWHEAEELAMTKATQMYNTLMETAHGDNPLSAMSTATYQQLTDAWQSVKDRIEQARFMSKQRQRLRQQLKGYRVMLHRMLENASAVPSKQMATLMRQITECHFSIEKMEKAAQSALQQASECLPTFHEPRRYAKYSYDPLLGIATYPLGFILLLLGASEIPLRILMYKRGFERRRVGQINYYFHPGTASSDDDMYMDNGKLPLVFVHGIGVGLIAYMSLIDALLRTGRPIMLPEIPYVSGFRPWQSPHAVLQPAVVCSTMTALLATHGFFQATWVGHSYGTSWLSCMCQYAPHAVAGLVFLDPICFCLHMPRLTQSFVYHKPDPGTISYVVRTDVIVNWTIQRSFPWAWIALFIEQITVPCAIFLSDDDALVPALKIEAYLKRKGLPVQDDKNSSLDFYAQHRMSTTIFRGGGHGCFTETPDHTVPLIERAIEDVSKRAEIECTASPLSPRRER
jgi:pimeloyl-ACP methyl ester carboxylesterase